MRFCAGRYSTRKGVTICIIIESDIHGGTQSLASIVDCHVVKLNNGFEAFPDDVGNGFRFLLIGMGLRKEFYNHICEIVQLSIHCCIEFAY